MSLFDSVLGSVLGGGQGNGGGLAGLLTAAGGNSELLHAVLGLVADDGTHGGLGGLVARFQQGGLGDVVQSWIASGHNLPVSAEQLQSVLGSDAISGLAQKAGLPAGDLLGQLSQLLPHVIDHLTPQGQAPSTGLGGLGALLGGLAPAQG